VTPNFYFISETSESLSVNSKSLKKIYRVENFRANVLKGKMVNQLELSQHDREEPSKVSLLTKWEDKR